MNIYAGRRRAWRPSISRPGARVAVIGLLTAVSAGVTAAPASAAGWSPPVVLSTASASPVAAPQASANAAGSAVVVWADAGVVRAAVRSTGGVWSAPTTISNPAETASAPVVAVRADGSAVALWTATRTSDVVIEYLAAPPRAAGPRRPPQRSRGPVRCGPQVAVDGAGEP